MRPHGLFFCGKPSNATTTTKGEKMKNFESCGRAAKMTIRHSTENFSGRENGSFLAWHYCIRSICVNNIGDTAILPKIDCRLFTVRYFTWLPCPQSPCFGSYPQFIFPIPVSNHWSWSWYLVLIPWSLLLVPLSCQHHFCSQHLA